MDDIITDLQDMRYLNWSKIRRSSGTAGSFLKAYDDTGKRKRYYKLSDYDPVKGIVGHECINEIIVQRMLDLLGIEHLGYTLIHALISIDGKDYETYLCGSEDFKKNGESKITLEDYYIMEKEGDESPLEFCVRKGWEEYIYGMLLIDYIVLNRDRHGANIEVLRDTKSKEDRLAPLFDHGISLVCRCHTIEELNAYDVMEDKRIQSFIGSGSALDNVRLIPQEYLERLPKFRRADLQSVFEGIDTLLGRKYVSKISRMIWERWCSLGSI